VQLLRDPGRELRVGGGEIGGEKTGGLDGGGEIAQGTPIGREWRTAAGGASPCRPS
jgi:hypothetical protein